MKSYNDKSPATKSKPVAEHMFQRQPQKNSPLQLTDNRSSSKELRTLQRRMGNTSLIQNPDSIHGDQASLLSPVLQGQFAMQNANAGAPPRTQAALQTWITANCSPKVQELITKNEVLLTITWNDTIADHGVTTMNLTYTDGANNAGVIDLFGGTAETDIQALVYPLTTYRVNVNTAIKTGGLVHANAPAGANAQSTWQATLVHELEAHTKLAKRIYSGIDQIERKPTHEAGKTRVMGAAIATRDGDSEHKEVAKGGSSIKPSQEKAVLSAATQAEQVDILIDSAWDRLDHMDFVNQQAAEKLALQDIRRWVNRVARKIGTLTIAEQARVTAIIGEIDNRLAAIY